MIHNIKSYEWGYSVHRGINLEKLLCSFKMVSRRTVLGVFGCYISFIELSSQTKPDFKRCSAFGWFISRRVTCFETLSPSSANFKIPYLNSV